MMMYNSKERALQSGTRPAGFHCPGIVPALLVGVLVLLSGCASRQSDAPAPSPPPLARNADIIETARSLIGVPYRFGGTSPQSGFDCSGLVCWSYEQVGVRLPRRASEQIKFGDKVERKGDLQPGDIVVFKGTRGRTGWHSGIYTGQNKFVHSPSTGKTVTESSLDEEYYARRFVGARRVSRSDSAPAVLAAASARERSMGPGGSSSPLAVHPRFAASAAKPGAFVHTKKGSRKTAAAVRQSPGRTANPVLLASTDAARGKKNSPPATTKVISGKHSGKSMKVSASKGGAGRSDATGVRHRAEKASGPPTGKKYAKPKGG